MSDRYPVGNIVGMSAAVLFLAASGYLIYVRNKPIDAREMIVADIRREVRVGDTRERVAAFIARREQSDTWRLRPGHSLQPSADAPRPTNVVRHFISFPPGSRHTGTMLVHFEFSESGELLQCYVPEYLPFIGHSTLPVGDPIF